MEHPQPGKVPVLRATVYIPKELVAEFRNEGTSYKRATSIMKNLGPFVLRQISDQLSVQAMTFLGKLSPMEGKGLRASLDGLDKEAVLGELDRLGRNGKQPEQAAMAGELHDVLKMVWEAEEEQGELNPQLEDKLPYEIRQTRRQKKTA